MSQQRRIPINRLETQLLSVELAKYANLNRYVPKIGDFVVWHGWMWGHWFGVVSEISGGNIVIIRSGLPKLLFTTPESDRSKLTTKISIDKIRRSHGGEYTILQEGVWFIDD